VFESILEKGLNPHTYVFGGGFGEQGGRLCYLRRVVESNYPEELLFKNYIQSK